MRVGEWIGSTQHPHQAGRGTPRSPQRRRRFSPDRSVHRDGSWERSGWSPGCGATGRRDAYLRPWGARIASTMQALTTTSSPVLDLNGAPITEQDSILYWSDGFHQLGNPSYNGFARMTPKQHSGWANL
ncbi:MAG: hypothetical protein R2856_26965 [Caldilineaceae bacterium]